MTHSKKILFIDNDNFQTEMRAQLLTDTRQHQVDIADSFEHVKELYKKNKYDIVIIDFARDFGAEGLRYIDAIDRMQKMITISENEEYSEQKGCDYCVSHHQRRRLVPPFPFPELVRLVESFELTVCTLKNKF
jgi:DNA-binding NtrC family response regulator